MRGQVHAVVEQAANFHEAAIRNAKKEQVASPPARASDVKCSAFLVKFRASSRGLWVVRDLGEAVKNKCPVFLSLAFAEPFERPCQDVLDVAPRLIRDANLVRHRSVRG